MRRQQLDEMLAAIARATGVREIVLVGSQSLHGQVRATLSSIVQSHEADIFIARDDAAHDAIDDGFGPNSDYYAEHGIYADTVGAGIVSPPPGWRERLVPMRDERGEVRYLALEAHDTAVAKLIAGREKDFACLGELLEIAALDIEVFMQRVSLMIGSPYAGALRPRLEKLAALLRARHWRHLLPPVERLLAAL